MNITTLELPAGSLLKAPQRRCKPGETYTSSLIRWRKRNNEYRDALVATSCVMDPDDSALRQFRRAFHGVSAIDAAHVLAPKNGE